MECFKTKIKFDYCGDSFISLNLCAGVCFLFLKKWLKVININHNIIVKK